MTRAGKAEREICVNRSGWISLNIKAVVVSIAKMGLTAPDSHNMVKERVR